MTDVAALADDLAAMLPKLPPNAYRSASVSWTNDEGTIVTLTLSAGGDVEDAQVGAVVADDGDSLGGRVNQGMRQFADQVRGDRT